MTKFNIGDRVRVRFDAKTEKGTYFNPEMDVTKGHHFTIVGIYEYQGRDKIVLQGQERWTYHPEWLEFVARPNPCGISGHLEAPPLGLLPRHIHDTVRLTDISLAIMRYVESNKPIPEEWIEEYNELVGDI